MPSRDEFVRQAAHQKWCDWCRKRLRKGQGIRLGVSVANGIVKVCNQTCLVAWNTRGEIDAKQR